MIKTYLCLGGPLDGHKVSIQYAGPDYRQFNNSGSAKKSTRIHRNGFFDKTKWTKVEEFGSSCVLVYKGLVQFTTTKPYLRSMQ